MLAKERRRKATPPTTTINYLWTDFTMRIRRREKVRLVLVVQCLIKELYSKRSQFLHH